MVSSCKEAAAFQACRGTGKSEAIIFTLPVTGAEWSLINTMSAGSFQKAMQWCIYRLLCEMKAETNCKEGPSVYFGLRVFFVSEKAKVNKVLYKVVFWNEYDSGEL